MARRMAESMGLLKRERRLCPEHMHTITIS